MDTKILGKRIKVARVEQDLTQTGLAKKIGANQKSVSRYENGIVEPSLSTMAKIAKILKKSVDHFLE